MSSAFIIKSARIETLSIILKSGDIESLTAQLQASAADFANLKGMPFLLDVHQLPDPWGLDIKAVWKCFAAYQIRIIGIRHIEADYEAKVLQYGLPFILISGKEKDAAQPAAKPVNTQPANTQPAQSHVQQEQVERLKNQVLQLKQQLQQAQAQPQTIMQQEQVERLKEQILQLKQSQSQQAEQANAQIQALQKELQQAKQHAQQASEQPQIQHPVQRNLPTSSPTVMMDKPVRSGQQIYAEGGDVICNALVSQGSEIIADGNIHIYAPFRGRALAGASGDKTARIYIQSMEGQLVSIAGIYRIFDKELPAALRGKSVVVSLDGDKLNITAMGSH